jgi:hypothetical protein
MKRDRLIGRYEYIGNPCTTKPCLPGMAYAVRVGDADYYLTVDGRWFSDSRSWNGYTPEPGDPVAVSGEVRDQRDVLGNPFHTIEVAALERAA